MNNEKPMTLAEAIKLGSFFMEPEGGSYHNSKWTAGCALGMAMLAHGKIDAQKLDILHPMLLEQDPQTGDLISDIIVEKFDYTVAPEPWGEAPRRMSLDALIEWVARRERKFAEKQAKAAAKAAKRDAVAAAKQKIADAKEVVAVTRR